MTNASICLPPHSVTVCIYFGYEAIDKQLYDGTPVLFGVGLVLIIVGGVIALGCFNDRALEIPSVVKFNKVNLGAAANQTPSSSGNGVGTDFELSVMEADGDKTD
eukprot:TRINITY_DN5551_c0_g1_i2.p1 TRINITY_DN5551_c0_g1~~TRINITY_DN5551_c0_g1_i2.p1  ORF type:complete len:105 (+),score=13.63 TRINITY_DN5551_c0_g1_i2:59-373(+)